MYKHLQLNLSKSKPAMICSVLSPWKQVLGMKDISIWPGYKKNWSEHGQKALLGANWVVVSKKQPKHTLTQKRPRNPTLRCGWITARCSYFKVRPETIRGGNCSLEKWGQWENPKVQSQPVVRGWWHPRGCKSFPESYGSSLLERKQRKEMQKHLEAFRKHLK